MKKSKTVFLTGASRGIGKAIFKKLNKQGYKIITPSRKELDLSDPTSIKRLTEVNKKLKVDILINNAGINLPQWIDELEDKNLEETLRINLISPISLIRAFVPYMKQQKWGRIVNISSMFGVVARGKQTPYVASKHGLNGVTKTLALELGPYNILVNSVCPGFVKTDLVLRNPPEKLAALAKDVPLGRLAEPEEIAELVSYLISDKNSYITGTNILIDGGYTCR
ncbi:short-chain dehydrogenase [Candidatus Roizmanbacteria bacterium RIFCSPLOWO2_01_FULL_37_12]|uniref:Short-chain dehydrogenase n=1 Tax=Candidatus Roizmanbacteria bacterium RIFCSPLOWO2_01_FULL_37_12 TaxID=1802056 RepID=A0A1F7IFQ1_9BACT|nr:MAG: short-chain dehydrogenase [Candidatus Roizmanbacteria bacterium RIFCSPHIGHO2_02_FULL_37_9b]OGK42160.1 MAG: short-chain dehydrogenase [Candidatus Roizmanbacteria bacterium RIFCSPLOWO2_01_FULL_37_12]